MLINLNSTVQRMPLKINQIIIQFIIISKCSKRPLTNVCSKAYTLNLSNKLIDKCKSKDG